VATPRPALGHAHDRSIPSHTDGTSRPRTSAWLRSGLLLAAATVAVGLLPGTALADPTRATTPEQAAQLVTDASHQLEIVSEQVNEARVELDQQQAAADSADKAAADAQAQLDALGGQIRQIARSAYTTGDNHLATLDVLLTSSSADEFVAQLSTLNAIAGHTNGVLDQVSAAAHNAQQAREAAHQAAATAQHTLDDVIAQQADLTAQIEDYKAQFAALSAPQQQQVSRAQAGEDVAAPVQAASVVASNAAAQAAVSTALAHVGDPYVWGAAGPDAFDCSGLTQYAYAAAGISLPHSSSLQSRMGTPVARADLQPGDLVFFYSPVSHVAMYIGNGQMVHASTSGVPVKVVSVDSMPGYNSARRIAG
jgi:cell wall-associated NlpC family hydrolase